MTKTLLFVYGTLRNPEIQTAVLGKTMTGSADILENFRLGKIQLGSNWYPLAIPSEKEEVAGLVLEIEESDFPMLDAYESNAYYRKRICLKSKRMAWVYLKNHKIKSP